MKHTPGPWHWREGFLTSDFDGPMDTATVLENSEAVEISPANARLIAAAPAMLNELENALEEFRPNECGCDVIDGDEGRSIGLACYFHRIEESIKRVIAKAAGGK